MGHDQTITMKKMAWVIIKKYYTCLGNHFHTNTCVCEEITIIPSKKLLNKMVGYVMHLMMHIQRGPVSNTVIKPQRRREKKERIMFLRSHPWIRRLLKWILTLKKMLKLLDFGNLSNLQFTEPTVGMNFHTPCGAIWIFLLCCNIFNKTGTKKI